MTINIEIFLSFVISFSISYFIIPKIVKVARIKKLFDVPGHRSAAKRIVPRLGGVAILFGFIISVIITTNRYNINELKYIFVSILTMFMIGLKDDFIGLAARKKLFIQLMVAVYLVFLGGYSFTNLHGILGFNEINPIAGGIISVIAIVGIINAFNLIDGIDGLASGISIFVSIFYGFWFLNAGAVIYSLACFSFTGSLIAFFIYNVSNGTNKIFMGDTGSLILGTFMAAITIHFNEFPVSNLNLAIGRPAISLALIIVPIVDTIRIFTIRLSQKHSPFSPDMNHIHHNLLKLTGKHLPTSMILIVSNMILVLITLLLAGKIDNNLLFFLLIGLSFLLAGIPSVISKLKHYDDFFASKSKSIYALSILFKRKKD
jgi:UDP-N-acetylmuramyl pentapeptide phosphotransferase/UDP-N-acetylglucosamine-1-phosphate transferase